VQAPAACSLVVSERPGWFVAAAADPQGRLVRSPQALGLAKFKRARFLLASTSEAYGDPQVHPQPEEYWGNVNPVGPRGVYDEAKRYAEAMTIGLPPPGGRGHLYRTHL
jgi:hypothetical protein